MKQSIYLPKVIYEILPLIYTFFGLLFYLTVSNFYLNFIGIVLFIASYAVICMRYQYREINGINSWINSSIFDKK